LLDEADTTCATSRRSSLRKRAVVSGLDAETTDHKYNLTLFIECYVVDKNDEAAPFCPNFGETTMAMKVYLASDIHKEFGQQYFLPDNPVDLIVLAGDIDRGTGAVEVARWFQKKANVPVILLAGNHEAYHGDFHGTIADMRSEAAKYPNIHFLENNCIVIGGIRWLGATLWSNFGIQGPRRVKKSKKIAEQFIADFRLIRCRNRSLTADDIIERFVESYTWLEQKLAKPFEGKTVVVTHFAPHRAAIHARYLQYGGDELTPYFVPDCSKLMQQYRIDAWMYGHTHNSVDVVVENGTRVVSNQQGYPREDARYTNFDQQKIIML